MTHPAQGTVASAGRLRVARWSLDHPVACLAVVLALTAIAIVGLGRLELRTDGAAIYPDGDPIVALAVADRARFHEAEQVIVLLSARPGGPAVDSREGLGHLKNLHASLERLPGVDRLRIRSLATVLDARPEVSLLHIRPFLDPIPETADELAALRQRIHSSRLAEGLFLSPDGSAAALYVPLAAGANRNALVTAAQTWIDEQQRPDFELRLSGPVTAEVTLGRSVFRDLAWLVPIMVAVVAAVLFLSLGSLGGVIIPMAEVLMVLVWTLGAMGYAGAPITLVTTIVPVLLMTMGVTDEIHLLERLQSRLEAAPCGPDASGDRARLRDAMHWALGDIDQPSVLTSLTTAAGFLSFLSASMAPIRHFGLFTALGILLALGLTFTLVPALVVLLPASWCERRAARGAPSAASPLLAHERFVARHSGASLALGCLLVLLAAPGLTRLTVQDSWVDNFDPASPLASAERDFNRHFWGSYRFDVVFTSGTDGFFRKADGLRLMERFTELAKGGPHVRGVLSYLVPLEIIADVSRQAGRISSLPASMRQALQWMLGLIQDRIDLDQYLAADGKAARGRLFVNSADYARAQALAAYLERELPALVPGGNVRYHFSGDLPVALEVVRAIVTNQLRSVGWTLAAVALLLVLAYRSVRSAAIVMVPLLAAIPILLGGMGYAGLPLGIATSMFTALTIGVGVDFAIHYRHAYRRERLAGREHPEAVVATLTSTGRAIRWNVTVLVLGFLVLTVSALKPNHSLGVLLAAAIVACYATTLLFLPRLLRR